MKLDVKVFLVQSQPSGIIIILFWIVSLVTLHDLRIVARPSKFIICTFAVQVI